MNKLSIQRKLYLLIPFAFAFAIILSAIKGESTYQTIYVAGEIYTFQLIFCLLVLVSYFFYVLYQAKKDWTKIKALSSSKKRFKLTKLYLKTLALLIIGGTLLLIVASHSSSNLADHYLASKITKNLSENTALLQKNTYFYHGTKYEFITKIPLRTGNISFLTDSASYHSFEKGDSINIKYFLASDGSLLIRKYSSIIKKSD